MKRLRFVGCCAASAVALVLVSAVASAEDVKKVQSAVTPAPASAKDFKKAPSAVTPISRPIATWRQRYAGMNSRVEQGNVDLIFIGDSITHAWDDSGMGVWYKFYGKRNAVNLGISGDQTQHVLWRLDHGNIDGISPKLAVLMIGTNNAGNAHNTAEESAAGVKAVVEKLRAKLPQTKVLVLAIFPRGPKFSRSHPKSQREDQRDHREAGRRENGVLSRHRPEVPPGRRHAQQGRHARLASSGP